MKKVFILTLMVLLMTSLTQAQYKGKYAGWSTGYCFLKGPLIPADYRAFTHLVNFTAMVSPIQTIDSSGLCMKSGPFADSCHRHGIRALISIGGAGNGMYFASACSTASKQTKLVNNILGIIRQYNYDGVDIDWEDGTIDPNAYVGLFKQIRDSINNMISRPLLTAPAAYWLPTPLGAVFPYVDQLNFLTAYDSVKSLNLCLARALAGGVPKSIMGIGFGWGADNEVTRPDDILDKCRLAIDSGFGGVNAWEISGAPTFTLWILDSISRYVHLGGPGRNVPILSSPPNYLMDVQPTLSLTWNAITGASSYLVQVCLTADFSTQPIFESVVSNTGINIGPLSANTAYFWRVKALNNTSETAWSDIWTFTTAASTSVLPAHGGIFPPGMSVASSSVRFSISQVSRVVVRLYSVRGALLETIRNSLYRPGVYEISLKSSRFARGNYLVDLKAGSFRARKMIVLQ